MKTPEKIIPIMCMSKLPSHPAFSISAVFCHSNSNCVLAAWISAIAALPAKKPQSLKVA